MSENIETITPSEDVLKSIDSNVIIKQLPSDAKMSAQKDEKCLAKRDKIEVTEQKENNEESKEIEEPAPEKQLKTEVNEEKTDEKTEEKSPLSELLGDEFCTKDNETVQLSELSDVKVWALYFSAGYCAPCHKFTPVLKEFYNYMNEDKKDLEVIFVSKDKTEEELLEYRKKMPWLNIPFGDTRIEKLLEKYQVVGIPVLLILNTKGEVVTMDGKKDVFTLGEVAMKKWQR